MKIIAEFKPFWRNKLTYYQGAEVMKTLSHEWNCTLRFVLFLALQLFLALKLLQKAFLSAFLKHFKTKTKSHRKIDQELNVKETKPPIVNQQCVVHRFQCDLFDAGYVRYTCRHLDSRAKGHKQQSSANAKHYKNVRGTMS